MGLRDFDVREFLKKNVDFITGVFSELGLVILVILAAFFVSFLPLLIGV